MIDKNINDLLSFSVFFLINEFVGLEFHGELETWNDFFIKGSIQIQSVTVEWAIILGAFSLFIVVLRD